MKLSLPLLFYRVPLPKKIQAVAIWPFVFVRKSKVSSIILQHERIHLRQQVEMGFLIFYIWYILEWLMRCIQTRSWTKGYYQISFEREAYRHEKTPQYLVSRRFWAFLNYL
ncbi:MAG: hypothetical protein ACK4LB_10915 [Spirosomataceae bacterium]